VLTHEAIIDIFGSTRSSRSVLATCGATEEQLKQAHAAYGCIIQDFGYPFGSH
jgi:hypothetical protein